MKAEGVTKKNYANVSLRLCIMYIKTLTQSYLLHTLSLSLLLSSKHTYAHTYIHTHTHTLTHTHTTHTYTEQIRQIWANQILGGWEGRFFQADLKVLVVVAFLMCCGSEFQTERPKKEKAWSPFVLHVVYRVEFCRGGCRHWSEEIKDYRCRRSEK